MGITVTAGGPLMQCHNGILDKIAFPLYLRFLVAYKETFR